MHIFDGHAHFLACGDVLDDKAVGERPLPIRVQRFATENLAFQRLESRDGRGKRRRVEIFWTRCCFYIIQPLGGIPPRPELSVVGSSEYWVERPMFGDYEEDCRVRWQFKGAPGR